MDTDSAAVWIEKAPAGCEVYYDTLLTHDAVQFVCQLVRRFSNDVTIVRISLYCLRRRLIFFCRSIYISGAWLWYRSTQ